LGFEALGFFGHEALGLGFGQLDPGHAQVSSGQRRLLAESLEALLLAPKRQANPAQINGQQPEQDADAGDAEKGAGKYQQHDEHEYVPASSVFPKFFKKSGPHKLPLDYS
jgi:hypothetical protein